MRPAPAPTTRAIDAPLMLGLIALPLLFVWLLLRPGYARSTFVAALYYALLAPTVSALAWLVG